MLWKWQHEQCRGVSSTTSQACTWTRPFYIHTLPTITAGELILDDNFKDELWNMFTQGGAPTPQVWGYI